MDAPAQPEVKDVPPLAVVSVERETTLEGIAAVAEEIVPGLYAAAQDGDLEITGPAVFRYENFCREPGKNFKVEMAVPVDKETNSGTLPAGFSIRALSGYRCACLVHEGSMTTIGESFGRLYDQCRAAGLKINPNHIREVYLNWVKYDSPENRTELQVEVAE